MGATPKWGLPYPDGPQIANVPLDMKALADRLELLLSQVGATGDLVWSVLAARPGAVACDGTLYNSVADPTFAALFAAVGTTYGGTGASSFAVPDVRGRLLVCKGTNADVNAVGKNDGDATVANRTPLHWHAATGLSWSGAFAGTYVNTTGQSVGHYHYVDGDTGYVSADHAHWMPVSQDGSVSGSWGSLVGTDHGANYNAWSSGIGTNHTHHLSINSGGNSVDHLHGVTPAGSVSGSVAGNVGATGARPKDVPSYIVENCFIVK